MALRSQRKIKRKALILPVLVLVFTSISELTTSKGHPMATNTVTKNAHRGLRFSLPSVDQLRIKCPFNGIALWTFRSDSGDCTGRCNVEVGKQDWELAFNASQTMIRRRWYCNLKKIQFTNPLKHCGSEAY